MASVDTRTRIRGVVVLQKNMMEQKQCMHIYVTSESTPHYKKNKKKINNNKTGSRSIYVLIVNCIHSQ